MDRFPSARIAGRYGGERPTLPRGGGAVAVRAEFAETSIPGLMRMS